MDVRTDGRIDGRMDGRTDDRINVRMDGRTDDRINVRTDGRTDEILQQLMLHTSFRCTLFVNVCSCIGY